MSRYAFSGERSVPSYDCDPFLRLRPAAALRYMQKTITEHLDSLGLPHDRLLSEGIVFVLAAQAVRFYRVPACGEHLFVRTCPVGNRGAQMLRETVIESDKGELLVEGQSSWAMIDPVSGRVLRPSAFRHELPLLERWEPFCDPSRLQIPQAGAPAGERPVRLSDLDLNRHLNNTVYADILLDCFGEEYMRDEKVVSELFLRYRTQARLGDVLELYTGEQDGLFLAGARVGERCCFEGAVRFR